jgi:hypothetical protein
MDTLRTYHLLAACSLVIGLSAQTPNPSKGTTPPDRNGRTDQPAPASIDLDAQRSRETSAGNPEGEQHPSDRMVHDTAFSVLLLDPDQQKRIRDMESRYAERWNVLRSMNSDEQAFRRLWEERETEIGDILTPVQFERWKELNRPKSTTPAPMPTLVPQGTTAPMPTQRTDSLHDAMPMRIDTVPTPR